MLSDRIPILPPFAPSEHISREAGILPFGEIFNLTTLRSTLHIPILEWKDLKSLPSSLSVNPYFDPSNGDELEDIGCWSTMPERSREPNRADNLVAHLGLDPSYTRVPARVRKDPNNANDDHVVFAQLAALMYPRDPLEPLSNFPIMTSSRRGGKEVGPGGNLACIDRMYYLTSGAEVFEWRFAWSPAWNSVGRHVRFNNDLVERSERYLRRAFGLEEGEEVPPFIAIHVRHGDFGNNCMLPGHCLKDLQRFAKRVEKVEERLLVKKGIAVRHYLLMSDETDPKFWEEAYELGWRYFDHEKEPAPLRSLPPPSLAFFAMSLPRVDSRSPLQASQPFPDRKPSSSLSTSFAPQQLLSALHPRKGKYRTTFVGLVFVVFLSTYIFLVHGSSLSPALALRRVDSPVANQLDVALESTENSRVNPGLADSPLPVPPPDRPLKHDSSSFHSGKGRHRQRPPLQLDSAQELAAISSFIASLPQNVIPPTVDPLKPIDPQLVLDFDTRNPRAADEVRQLVEECWSRNPVFLYSKNMKLTMKQLYSPSSRELKTVLASLYLSPAPVIVDVDMRDDAEVLKPILARLTSGSDLPILLVGGKVVGTVEEIKEMHKDGRLARAVSEAGAVVNGAKKKKGKK
ncbi:hypothetical protein MD484_g2673, partial [Candolleomyces efflorescens]